MGRAPCCEKVGLKKGRWTAEEDDILTKYIQAHGEGSWRSLPKNAGLLRCGKSCRLRWINYLRTDLKRGNISADEEQIIINLHSSFGNRWSLIAGHLPGRTDNEIKNYWNSHLSRKIYSFRNTTQPQPVADTKLTFPKPRGGKTSRWAKKKNKALDSTRAASIIIGPVAPDVIQNHNGSGDPENVALPSTPAPENETLLSGADLDDEFCMAVQRPGHVIMNSSGPCSDINNFSDVMGSDPLHDPYPYLCTDLCSNGESYGDQWLSCFDHDRDGGCDWEWEGALDDQLWLQDNDGDVENEKHMALVAWLFS